MYNVEFMLTKFIFFKMVKELFLRAKVRPLPKKGKGCNYFDRSPLLDLVLVLLLLL